MTAIIRMKNFIKTLIFNIIAVVSFESNMDIQIFLYLKKFRNLYRFYGDGFRGLPAFAPFNKILITAAAPYIPPALIDQLAIGGLMVLPVNADGSQQMIRVIKQPDGSLEKEYFDFFSFVPMLKGKSE